MPEPDFVQARKTLDANLFDYPSSRFRDVRVIEYRNPKKPSQFTYALCGFVNAPNRAGGMVGWKVFSLSLDGKTFNTGDFRSAMNCGARDDASAKYWTLWGDDLTDRIRPPDLAY